MAATEYPFEFEIESGNVIKIEAWPEEGYQFVEWDTIGSNNPKYVDVVRDISITAFFTSETRIFNSPDNTIEIVVPGDSTALDGEGHPLNEIDFLALNSSSCPDSDASIIGVPYQLEPDGATFGRPVSLAWNYSSYAIPEGLAEENMVLAIYDENDDKWQELEFETNFEENLVTAYIDHFSTFALIASPSALPDNPICTQEEINSPPSETAALPASCTLSSLSISPSQVQPGEDVTISIYLSNSSPAEASYPVSLKLNGALEETREIYLGGGSGETVSFTSNQSNPGEYPVDINGLTGSFKVEECTTCNMLGTGNVGEESTNTPGGWLNRTVIICIAASIAIPLSVRFWRRRREDYGSLGDYISMRYR